MCLQGVVAMYLDQAVVIPIYEVFIPLHNLGKQCERYEIIPAICRYSILYVARIRIKWPRVSIVF